MQTTITHAHTRAHIHIHIYARTHWDRLTKIGDRRNEIAPPPFEQMILVTQTALQSSTHPRRIYIFQRLRDTVRDACHSHLRIVQQTDGSPSESLSSTTRTLIALQHTHAYKTFSHSLSICLSWLSAVVCSPSNLLCCCILLICRRHAHTHTHADIGVGPIYISIFRTLYGIISVKFSFVSLVAWSFGDKRCQVSPIIIKSHGNNRHSNGACGLEITNFRNGRKIRIGFGIGNFRVEICDFSNAPHERVGLASDANYRGIQWCRLYAGAWLDEFVRNTNM